MYQMQCLSVFDLMRIRPRLHSSQWPLLTLCSLLFHSHPLGSHGQHEAKPSHGERMQAECRCTVAGRVPLHRSRLTCQSACC